MSTSKTILISASTAAFAAICFHSAAFADPLPGEVLKFQQKPLNNTVVGPAIYNGHDSPSTAYPAVLPNGTPGFQGFFFADDFADNFSSALYWYRCSGTLPLINCSVNVPD